MLAIIILGALIGLINGLIVTRIGIPSFIVTLAMLTAYRSLAIVVSNQLPINVDPTGLFFDVTGGYIGDTFPWLIIWLVVFVVVVGIVAVTIAFATRSAVSYRPPKPPLSYLLSPISDWRAVSGAKLEPTDVNPYGLNGNEAAAAYARGVRGYFRITDKEPRPARDPNAFVLTLGSIGVPAYDAGRRVWVVDIGGLAEPLAARTSAVPGRPAGHRKQVDDAWYDARFGTPASSTSPADVAARHALQCGPMPGLLEAVDGSMTPGRFLSNMWHSFSYTRLHVPADPEVAEQLWCKPSG
jgi:hypothetical protein